MLQRDILETRDELIKLLPKKSIGVEIGVFQGEFSDIIINLVSPSKIYLIDPWVGKIHSGDKDGKNIKFIEEADKYFYDVIQKKYEKNNNVFLIKNTSGILRDFEDNFFDWGYIDGNHSYFGVKHDLELLRNKVKHQGVIMGHDYLIPKNYGLVKAVNEFCRKYNLKIDYLTKDDCPSYYIINKK